MQRGGRLRKLSVLTIKSVLRTPSEPETVTTQPAPREVALSADAEHANRQSPFLDPPDAASNSEAQAAGMDGSGAIQQVSGTAQSAAPSDPANANKTTLQKRVDAHTMARIESVFQNASPSVKASWYSLLLRTDPDQIHGLLNAYQVTIARPNDEAPSIERVAHRGPSPSEFVSHPPSGPAPQTVVQPGSQASPQPHPLAPTVTPGQPPMRSQQPLTTIDSPRPRTVVQAPRPELVAESTDVAQTIPPNERPRATWPLNDQPVEKVRRTGFIEMPTEAPITQAAATQDPASGKYALANDWDTQLRRLIDLIEQEVAKPPSGTSDDAKARQAELHVYLRMLYLMDGQQTRSLQAIPDMAPEHQEFWTQMFWSLTNYFDREGIADSGDRATETISQLREAIERLKPESRLQLRNANFSHKIKQLRRLRNSFDRDEFEAGQPVLVYVEVQNFASELNSEGRYKTRLRSTIEIHKAGRGPESGLVHSQDYPATEDTCRNLRQDYFHSYRIDLPDELTPGPHTLKLMVEDELSQRIATASLSFVVK